MHPFQRIELLYSMQRSAVDHRRKIALEMFSSGRTRDANDVVDSELTVFRVPFIPRPRVVLSSVVDSDFNLTVRVPGFAVTPARVDTGMKGCEHETRLH